MFKFDWNTSLLSKKESESSILDQMSNTLSDEFQELETAAGAGSSVSKAELIFNEVMKRSKTPAFIIGGIDIDHFDIGHVSPQLCLKQVLELSDTKLKALFHLSYTGDASLCLKTTVEANSLALSGRKTRFALPLLGSISARSLPVPLVIKITEFNIDADVMISFTKDKGLSIVFMGDDPLKGVVVSSSFDFLPSIAATIRTTIHERLSEIIKEDIPISIYSVTMSRSNSGVGTPELRDVSDDQPSVDTNITTTNDVIYKVPIWTAIRQFFQGLMGFNTNVTLSQQQLLSERSSLSVPETFDCYAGRGMEVETELYDDCNTSSKSKSLLTNIDLPNEKNTKHNPRRRTIRLNAIKAFIEEGPVCSTPIVAPEAEVGPEDRSPVPSVEQIPELYSTPRSKGTTNKGDTPPYYDASFGSDSSWLTSSPPTYDSYWTLPVFKELHKTSTSEIRVSPPNSPSIANRSATGLTFNAF